MVVIGMSPAAAAVVVDARARGMPVLYARLHPEPGLRATLASGQVLAFAGIADPQKFFASLADVGITVGATRSFPIITATRRPKHGRYATKLTARVLPW